ncbi:hypothetical protein ILUMI_00506 [Ignelater luminosus]|uniref:Potassium channel domain-containing protein n=1 Tax=Ignelater luminosus TaxID=2038154 RepID=A0A8K0GL58_IGNLU|nr:hypothetical protein ILUMI_00506 [Ignelater luminosus]
MMSKKQWFSLLCIHMCYILFGATIFYLVESAEEEKRLFEEENERYAIEGLMEKNYISSEEHTLNDIYYKISDYCSKPLGDHAPQKKTQLTWTYYHAIFFVLTIVSTIGYGNLSPTTPFTRTFMILYGLIGIPINGMVVITLGDFFGKSFLKLYRRWKNTSVQHTLATFGLIGQIFLYLLPGMAFFIFIPSLVIVLYEEWNYVIAVEFAFATLTTIGVGSYVPGTRENDRGEFLFLIYRIFLLVWIIMGLGYLAMVFGFISRGLQSKKLHTIEHKIAHNIKKTNRKIRQEFRSILNEYLLMNVKPIYRERRRNITPSCERTLSCPDLSFGREIESPRMRRRAVSELTKPSLHTLSKTHSETDLQCIDKERTFMTEADLCESNKFLLKVANALGNYNMLDGIVEDSSDKEHSETDSFNSNWTIGYRRFSRFEFDEMRPRAASESRKEKTVTNFHLSKFKNFDNKKLQEVEDQQQYGRARSQTLPTSSKPYGLLKKFKNSFRHKEHNLEKTYKDDDTEGQPNTNPREEDLESTYTVSGKDRLLEEISIADFLRALGKVDGSMPRRKFGVVHQPHPDIIRRARRLPITPTLSCRRTSLIPASPSRDSKHRKFSLDPNSASNGHTVDNASPVFPTIVEVENEKEKRSNKRTRRMSVIERLKFKNEKVKKV